MDDAVVLSTNDCEEHQRLFVILNAVRFEVQMDLFQVRRNVLTLRLECLQATEDLCENGLRWVAHVATVTDRR